MAPEETDTSVLELLRAGAADFETVFDAMPDVARMRDAAELMGGGAAAAAQSSSRRGHPGRRRSSLTGSDAFGFGTAGAAKQARRMSSSDAFGSSSLPGSPDDKGSQGASPRGGGGNGGGGEN